MGITIHKSQERTLELGVIDLGTSENCCGISLIALSRVKKIKKILLKPFSYELSIKINKSKHLPKVKVSMAELERKFQVVKESYHFL